MPPILYDLERTPICNANLLLKVITLPCIITIFKEEQVMSYNTHILNYYIINKYTAKLAPEATYEERPLLSKGHVGQFPWAVSQDKFYCKCIYLVEY